MKTHRFLRSALCTAATLVAAATSANAQIASYATPNTSTAGCLVPASNPGWTAAPGVSLLDLCRGAGLGTNSANTSYNSNNWSANEAAAVSGNDYLSFGVTLNAGVQGNFESVVMRAQRSNTGPTTLGLRSSLDNFTTTIATVTTVPTSASNVTFDFPDFQACGTSVEFRIYGWGASGGTGTLRAQGTPANAIVINGNVDICNTGGPTGACCLPDGSCVINSEVNCNASSGTYAGDDVSCDSANCPPPATGGCCVAGVCQLVTTQTNCVGLGGTWGGAGTDCNTFACPGTTGICCTGGTCTITTQTTCTTGGGSWTTGSSCSPTSCPAVGACCVGTSCTLTDFASCGGTWLGRGVVCGANACVRPALAANVIAVDDFDLQRDAASFTLTRASDGSPLPAPIVAQLFGIGQRYRTTPEPMPFALLDDTTSIFAGDTIGLIRESKVDSWFGATNMYAELAGDASPDTDPTQLGEDEAQATWTFNIAGRNNLSIALDMAAMGDFEGVNCSAAPACVEDRYTFAVSIDGGPFTDIFVIRPDQNISQSYTLASGASISYDDPMKVDGTTVLTNIFTNFSKNVTGTGNVLTLRLRGQADGGTDEAFAFDNLTVRGDVAPTTGACCTAGTCTVTTEALCTLGGGTFTSVGSVCDAGTCNTAPTPCQLADFNDSGSVTADDIFAFLDAWFAQNGSTGPGFSADINANDSVTADDIFAFLDLWFAQNGQSCN